MQAMGAQPDNHHCMKSFYLQFNVSWHLQAAELLKHPHLQPYVLDVHLKLNSPRRDNLPCPTYEKEKHNARKIRFSDPVHVPLPVYRERHLSCGNDRTLNPSISGADQSYGSSNKIMRTTPSNQHRGMKEVTTGSIDEGTVITKNVTSKGSVNRRITPPKASTTTKRAPFSKNQDTLPASKSLVKKSVSTTRRASLPFPGKDVHNLQHSLGTLRDIDIFRSPDISVNAPRMDKMVEFPQASYEESFPVCINSLGSVQGSSSPPQVDCSIMKDRCTIQSPDKPGRRSFNSWQEIQQTTFKKDGSEYSDQNATAGASSRTSSDQRCRRFDMSSYRQRAEALEGLLEFSARLLQQQRIEELEVLLKPFGPGKASPRETAIWLSKSFKEKTPQPEDFLHWSCMRLQSFSLNKLQCSSLAEMQFINSTGREKKSIVDCSLACYLGQLQTIR